MQKIINLSFINNLMKKGKLNIMFLIGVIGIALIFASEIIPNKTITAKETKNNNNEYKINLEKQLTELLSQIDGVGKVKVMITLESTEENVYAQQEKTQTDSQKNSKENTTLETIKSTYENEFVMVNNNQDKTALVEKTVMPIVQGVAVVCTGADDIKVVSSVTNAIAVTLDVSTNRICVAKMR